MAQDRKTDTAAVAHDIVHLLGDAVQINAILALSPSLRDIEEAALWYQGNGDILDEAGHPLEGKAAAIFDLLQTEQNDPDR